MRLRDFIIEEAILPELRAKTARDALTEMVRSLAAAGCLDTAAVEPVVDALLAREGIGTTGLGHGVAFPHTKHRMVHRLLGTFAHSTAGIDYNAMDRKPVKCFFLILWPDGVIGPHLEAIAQISRALRLEGFLDRLMALSVKKDIVSMFAEADDRMQKQR